MLQARKYHRIAKKVVEKISKLPSQDEIDKLVSDMMRYVMFKSYQTISMPIRPEEFSKLVQDKGYQLRGLSNAIIALTQERLVKTFGMELREVKRMTKKKGSNISVSTGSYYVVISLLPIEMRKRYLTQPSLFSEKALMMIILCLLYVSFNMWNDISMKPILCINPIS